MKAFVYLVLIAAVLTWEIVVLWLAWTYGQDLEALKTKVDKLVKACDE
jgi:hypothetical protein